MKGEVMMETEKYLELKNNESATWKTCKMKPKCLEANLKLQMHSF